MNDTPAHHDEDEEDDLPCYRHPDRLTALRCLTCDRPICVDDCAVYGAVGIKCPEHGRTSRAERGAIPTAKIARGAGAAIGSALVAGYAIYVIGSFVFILGYLAGIAIGEATRRATGGFRDAVIAKIAGLSALCGVLAFPVLNVVAQGASLGGAGRYLLWYVIGAAAAAYAAVQRSS